jgi:hypothetical protein
MRRAAGVLLMFASFFGCRGIIGIEDLNVADAGVDGGKDSGGSSSSSSSSSGGGEGGAPDAGGPCVGKTGPECGKCCRDNFRDGVAQLEANAKNTGCICGAGPSSCATECATEIYAGNPPIAGGACSPCIDQQLRTPACKNARDACNTDACRTAAACEQQCL